MHKSSYMYRPRQSSYVYRSVPDLLDSHAAEDPDKTAHVFWIRRHDGEDIKRIALSFDQLADGSRRLAVGLLRLGLQPGDRVAMYGPATPEWILMDLACLRIHVLVVRLPQSLVNCRHLVDFLSKHRCRAFFLDCDREMGTAQRLRSSYPEAFEQVSKLLGSSRMELVVDLRLTRLLADANAVSPPDAMMTIDDIIGLYRAEDVIQVQQIQNSINPDEVSFVYPTSGSTGRPKLVALSHFAVVNTLYGTVTPQTVIFNDRLFSWIGSACHISSVTGCTHVHVESSFAALPENQKRLVDILSTEGVHVASVPVYLLHDLVGALEKGHVVRPTTLSAFSTSGEGTPAPLRARILRLGLAHASGYGSTETGTIGVDIAAPKPAELAPENNDVRHGTSLALQQGVEVKVTDDNGRMMEAGKKGILWVRSRLAFLGYLDDEASTSSVLTASGWLNSGDLAAVDPGSLTLTLHGRVADVISKGGVKVYPAAVEAVLRRHPGVQTVCVAGVPDDRYQEEIGACVVLKTGCDVSERDLVRFCENNSNGYSAISTSPRYIAFVQALPLLPTGKIDRFQVKAFLQSKKNEVVVSA